MVNYECKLCNFKTHLKTDFKRHLNTLKHGRNLEQMKTNPLERAKKSQKRAKKSQKEPKRAKNEPKKLTFDCQFTCDYCGSEFKTFANKRRHELHRCKKIKHIGESATIQENRDLKEQRKIMLKQIDQLIKKAGNTTYNTQNNTQTNIKLNGFGNENLSFITDAFKTQLVKGPYGMIPKMIEHIHFNDNVPENKNISLPNKKENIIKIFSGDKWVFKNKNEVINDLVDGKYFILDTHYETLCNNGENERFYKNVYQNFKTLFDSQDKQVHDYIKEQCELVLLNNR